jgi:DNA-binding GntR family transcriptional regulator
MSGIKSIHPLPAVTRRTQVVDALREAILSGELPPGSKITELDLVARLHVSRGPIREGIRELIDEGLLVSQPYTGTYVTIMDEKAITEAYGLRRVLDKYAFTLVWPHRDAEFRARLVDRYEALIAAARAGGTAREMKAEMEFHGLPYEFSGDALLLSTWRHVARRMQVGFILHRATPDSPSMDSESTHQNFLKFALGDDLDMMLAEIDNHIDMGLRDVAARRASNEGTGFAGEGDTRARHAWPK